MSKLIWKLTFSAEDIYLSDAWPTVSTFPQPAACKPPELLCMLWCEKKEQLKHCLLALVKKKMSSSRLPPAQSHVFARRRNESTTICHRSKRFSFPPDLYFEGTSVSVCIYNWCFTDTRCNKKNHFIKYAIYIKAHLCDAWHLPVILS